MFKAVVFGQKLESTQVHIFGRMDKLWYTHRMGYHTATRMNKLRPLFRVIDINVTKEASYKTLYTVWFHLYKVQK